MIKTFEQFLNEDSYATTPSNTNGMGNITHPTGNEAGSGDLLDDEEDEEKTKEIKDKE